MSMKINNTESVYLDSTVINTEKRVPNCIFSDISQNYCNTEPTASGEKEPTANKLVQATIQGYSKLKEYAKSIQKNKQTTLNSNKEIALDLIKQFKEKYPNVKSCTLLASIARDMERKGGNKSDIEKLYQEANSLSFEDKNNKNCEERAKILDRILSENGYSGRKAVVLIHGEQNLEEGYIYGAHVFNIIGLGKNADVTNLGTWGDNAIIVDVWAEKVFTPEEGITFYRDFLGYDYDKQPLFIEEVNSNN